MESYETCVDIGERFQVPYCSRTLTEKSWSPSCHYRGETCFVNWNQGVTESNDIIKTKIDENNNREEKKETCCEWLKSLLGFGKKNIAQENENPSYRIQKKTPGPSSAPSFSIDCTKLESFKSCLDRRDKLEANNPCERAGAIYFSTTRNNGIGDNQLKKQGSSDKVKTTERGKYEENTSFILKSKSPDLNSKSKSPTGNSKSPTTKSKSPRSKSKSPESKSRSPASKSQSPKQRSCLSSPNSTGDRVFRRASKPQSTQSSAAKMCSPCPLTCPCMYPSPCRLRSLSLTCLRPRCSTCQSCSPKCKCASCCKTSTCGSPRRCRVPKTKCFSPSRSCRPRSCPRPSRCSCPLCCQKPCPPRKGIFCPCLPGACCSPCVSKPKCLSCCTKCSPGPCSYTPTRFCNPCSVCPKVCVPSPCCKPMCSLSCCPFPRSTCSFGMTSKYDRSKRGDALCNMLMAKYSRPCPGSSCFSSRISCGGCRICPGPENITGGMPVPGCNRTNSRQSISPDRKSKQNSLISYTSSPNSKTPYKEIDLSSSIYTPCVKRTGPRSAVQHFHALKKTESPSSSPLANVNNGAVTDDIEGKDLDNLRVRVEGHYDRRHCRINQANALQKCDVFLNCLCSQSNHCREPKIDGTMLPICLSQQCRNNNFGDENFRFFRKYLNITPTPQIQTEEAAYCLEPSEVERDISQNMTSSSENLSISTAIANPEHIEEQISRMDNWILSKDNKSVPPPPKQIKKKGVIKKKSNPSIGAYGGINRKTNIKSSQRRAGPNVSRTPRQTTEGEAAALRLIMQPDFVKLRSPQKSGDHMINHAENSLETQSAKETSYNETTKILLPPESKLSSPLKNSFSKIPSIEREHYTPSFTREEKNNDKSPTSEVSSTSPRGISMYTRKPTCSGEHVKLDSSFSPGRDLSTIGQQSRSSSRSRSPLRYRSVSPDRSPRIKGVHISKKNVSPKLQPGESCVDPDIKKRTPQSSPRVKSTASHSSPGAKSIISELSGGGKSTSSHRSPTAKSIKSQRSSNGDTETHISKSSTSQANPSIKKTFFSTIASIWGAPPRKSVCVKEQSLVHEMSKEHILSGKESSVDLERENRVALDGSSNNECVYSPAITHDSALIEHDENDEDMYECDIDFDINAHSSRESLVEVNKSQNSGGHNMEDNVPCCESDVTADIMASPVSTMTGTITTCISPKLSVNSCTDSCNSSSTPVTVVPTITNSEQLTRGDSQTAPLSSKVVTSNLSELLASSGVMWQRIDKGDVDVSSIRSAKDAYFKRLKQMKAEKEKAQSSGGENEESSRKLKPAPSLTPLEDTIDDCEDSCPTGTLCTQ